MTQTNFSCPFKREIDPETVTVIHEECNTKAEFQLFGGGQLATYFCPKCHARVNAKAVLSGYEGWKVI